MGAALKPAKTKGVTAEARVAPAHASKKSRKRLLYDGFRSAALCYVGARLKWGLRECDDCRRRPASLWRERDVERLRLRSLSAALLSGAPHVILPGGKRPGETEASFMKRKTRTV